MMKVNRFVVQGLLLIFSMLVLSGCGKSIEKETSRWESNLQKVESLKSTYPGYAGLLAEEVEKAEVKWDAALLVADEKEQIKALALANDFVKRGMIKELLTIKSCLSSADQKVKTLVKMEKDSTEDTMASFAVKEAQMAISKAKTVLNSASADYSQAVATLSAAGAELKSAETSLDKAIRVIRDNDRASRPVATTPSKSSASKTTTTKSAPAKATTWKCAYCGAQNLNSITKCKSCGAPR
jgi:hypothetical protein